MNQISFDPWMSIEYQRRHKELIKKAAQIHLADEVRNARIGDIRNRTNILAQIGKGLVSIGTSLEKRFSSPPINKGNLTQQGDPREYS